MRSKSVVDTLNRMLQVHYHSLPMYVAIACPWIHQGEENAIEAVRDIVDDHRKLSRQIVEAIQQRRGLFDTGEYPIDFTDRHDLSLDFLLGDLIVHLSDDLKVIRECSAALAEDPAAKALADEAAGIAVGHLETLQELSGQKATS